MSVQEKMNRVLFASYSMNRFASFVLSAMMSFIFYSSLAGSNQFFFWFNGIAGVIFDIKKIELWDSGRKILASFFIAFSVVAFAGSSLMETERNSVKEADNSYIAQEEKDIKDLETRMADQWERVKNTSSNYGTAAQKESDIYNQLSATRDSKIEKLKEYKAANKSDASMSSFELIASALHVSVLYITWFFFIFRGVLLEVSVLATSKKKEKEVVEIERPVEKIITKTEYVKPPKFEGNEADRSAIEDLLDKWRVKAVAEKKINSMNAIDTIERYIKSFDDYVKKITS